MVGSSITTSRRRSNSNSKTTTSPASSNVKKRYRTRSDYTGDKWASTFEAMTPKHRLKLVSENAVFAKQTESALKALETLSPAVNESVPVVTASVTAAQNKVTAAAKSNSARSSKLAAKPNNNIKSATAKINPIQVDVNVNDIELAEAKAEFTDQIINICTAFVMKSVNAVGTVNEIDIHIKVKPTKITSIL